MIFAILAVIGMPLVMLLLLALPTIRPVIVRFLWLAAVPGMLFLPLAWQSGSQTFTIPGGWVLVLDQPGILMLTASALLWCSAGFSTSRWLRDHPDALRFSIWWLLTLAGSLGVFVSGDVASFYLLYAAASLPAYGLIVFDGGRSAVRAGRLTLVAALLGEALILAAFALLVAGNAGQGLSIADSVNALSQASYRDLVIALVIAGFGLKIGLVPLHGWMPLSYAAGPLASAAVLSGATSKAGVIGLIRFLPFDQATPEWGILLLAAGLFSAFYGAFVGFTQTNVRSVLAYSSVSQLGQMAAALGAGLAVGSKAACLAVAFYAVYHVLTKGGLFLALGVATNGRTDRYRPRLNFVVAAILAFGFAGLPLSAGALGKLALKPVFGDGAASLLLSLAAIGSSMLMYHFLQLLQAPRVTSGESRQSGSTAAWLATAAMALVLPWFLFANVTSLPASYAAMPVVLAELSWPVAIGLLLAWAIKASGIGIPHIPPGDVAGPGVMFLERQTERLAGIIAALEAKTREWHLSSLAIAVTFALFVALLSRQ